MGKMDSSICILFAFILFFRFVLFLLLFCFIFVFYLEKTINKRKKQKKQIEKTKKQQKTCKWTSTFFSHFFPFLFFFPFFSLLFCFRCFLDFADFFFRIFFQAFRKIGINNGVADITLAFRSRPLGRGYIGGLGEVGGLKTKKYICCFLGSL